jgi:hypothetical protein
MIPEFAHALSAGNGSNIPIPSSNFSETNLAGEELSSHFHTSIEPEISDQGLILQLKNCRHTFILASSQKFQTKV